MVRIDATEQRSRKKDGRKTTNDALITLLRAGVIASIMLLVLGAGMAAAFDDRVEYASILFVMKS